MSPPAPAAALPTPNMEGIRTIMATMGKKIPAKRRIAVLAAALLLSAAPASSQAAPGREAPPESAAGPAVGSPAAGKPAPGPSDPVQEKFRRLQKEMAAGDGSAPGDSPRAAPRPAPEPLGVFSLTLQVLLGLAFVLVLAVVCIRTLKRFQGRLFSRPGSAAGGDILEVLETCHLGAHQRVVAMRIHDEVGVLGVTQQGISLLTVLKQPAGEIRKRGLGAGNSAAFSENLNKLLDRFKKPKRVSDLLDEA